MLWLHMEWFKQTRKYTGCNEHWFGEASVIDTEDETNIQSEVEVEADAELGRHAKLEV